MIYLVVHLLQMNHRHKLVNSVLNYIIFNIIIKAPVYLTLLRPNINLSYEYKINKKPLKMFKYSY